MDLDIAGIFVGLLGGLSLFLYGMGQMTDALKQASGRGLSSVLSKLTTNRFTGVLSGAFITTLTQSSSVTTVLLVGFVSAGLMTLQQSMGVIMGANIGSTVTAQIIAFDISRYALLILSIGFAISSLSRNKKIAQYGLMVMGLGLVFFGMSLMSSATSPLRSYQPFIDLMSKMDNPFLGILVGAGFTALVQSSAATTGILIVLGSQGVITLEAGIVMAFGANIGTCITALLAAIGKPREAVQVAAMHVLFNVIGVLLWIFFVDQLADFVRTLSPSGSSTHGQVSEELPRQLANAHTLFNIGNTILLIGFTGPFTALINRLIPLGLKREPRMIQPKFIDTIYLQTPDLALQQIRLELGRIARRVVDMIEVAPLIVLHGRTDRVQAIATMGRELEELYIQIVDFSRTLGGREISEEQAHSLQHQLAVGNYLMSTADLVGTNFVQLANEVREHNLEVSAGTKMKMQELFEAVSSGMRDAHRAFINGDAERAREVVEMKSHIESLADETIDRLSERLLADEPNRVLLFRIQNETVNQVKRLYYFAKRISKVVLEEHQDTALETRSMMEGVLS